MRILISGVAGFLGSHLASLLVSQKHEVVGVDNFATGRRETVEALGAEAGFSFVEGDVTGPVRIDGPVDRVYHMATPSSAVVHGERKIAMLKANSEGTWNLLELALEKGAVFAGQQQRMLWRSEGSSAAGRLLGGRVSDRGAVRGGGGDAVCRGMHDDVSAGAWGGYADRPDIQYVWAGDGPAGWAGGDQLYSAGVER